MTFKQLDLIIKQKTALNFIEEKCVNITEENKEKALNFLTQFLDYQYDYELKMDQELELEEKQRLENED